MESVHGRTPLLETGYVADLQQKRLAFGFLGEPGFLFLPINLSQAVRAVARGVLAQNHCEHLPLFGSPARIRAQDFNGPLRRRLLQIGKLLFESAGDFLPFRLTRW